MEINQYSLVVRQLQYAKRSAPGLGSTENDPKQRITRVIQWKTSVFSLDFTISRGKEQGSCRWMPRTCLVFFQRHGRDHLSMDKVQYNWGWTLIVG